MKIKQLIHKLEKYDGETEVNIYSHPTSSPLLIPAIDPAEQVKPDPKFAQEYDLPKDTVFITGK